MATRQPHHRCSVDSGNTAIFSVVNSLLLKPLPFPKPEKLVEVMRSFPQGNNPFASVPQYFYWKENSQTAASYLPARRATQVNPIRALRWE